MMLSIFAILLVGLIAYFHYLQGMFSATLSAIFSVVAAALALSFHEVVVSKLQNTMAEQSACIALVVIFALVYIILRVLVDKAIPGNIRLPVTLDKIGAGVMGLVAGIFGVGILMIGAQTLPFGPSIAGYSRFPLLEPQSVVIPGVNHQVDATVTEMLKPDSLEEAAPSHLLLPVDDIVINVFSRLSSGALSGFVKFSDVHPAYLDEAFGQRIGIQPGAKHLSLNAGRQQSVSVVGLFNPVSALPQVDGELPALQNNRWGAPLRPTITSDPSGMVLIVRATLSNSDPDNNVRFSTGAARLVAGGKNHYPIGTLDMTPGAFVRANRPDDYLFAPDGAPIDFVFRISPADLGVETGNKNAPMKVGPDVFIEVKRMGMVDLSDMEITRGLPPLSETGVLRKAGLTVPKGLAPIAPPVAPTAPANSPIEYGRIEISPMFIQEFNVGRYDGDGGDTTFPAGTSTIRDKKFFKLEINATADLNQPGDYMTREFWTPGDQKMALISATPPAKDGDPWEWAKKLGQFELVDAAGKTYKPNGAWARIKVGTSDRVIARFNAETPPTEIPVTPNARPTDVWFAFLLPDGTAVQELRYQGKKIATATLQVPN